MFISINWIKDFVDLSGLDINELIHQFSLSTAEVENEIFYKGSDISGIVVAEIKSVEEHHRRCLRCTERKSRHEDRICKGRRKDRRD